MPTAAGSASAATETVTTGEQFDALMTGQTIYPRKPDGDGEIVL